MDLSSYFVCLNGVIKLRFSSKWSTAMVRNCFWNERAILRRTTWGSVRSYLSTEIYTSSKYSKVGSRDWQTFVEDYFRYLIWLILFQGSGVHFRLPKKCCVLAIMTSMWGWLWIRFWGFSTLIKKFFSQSSDLEENLKEYCQGYFHQHNQHWHVFLFSRLLQNPHYMNASTKFIN